MKISKNAGEKVTVLGSVLSFALAAAIIKLSGFSVDVAVNILGTFIKQAFIQTNGLNTFGSVMVVIDYFIVVTIGLVFLTLAFSFLASYGYKNSRKRFGLVLSFIGGLIFFFFLGFTLASFVTAVAVFVAGYTIIPLANTYGQEFKKWVSFRLGSNSVSRALFIFNLIVGIAIFFAVLSNLSFYQAEFRTDLKDSMTSVVMPILPGGVDQAMLKDLVDKQIDAALNAPIFTAYIRWLPVVSAVGVWMLLEILRFFLPFVAGVFVSLIKKVEG